MNQPADEDSISIPVNLDDEGFLRRECPHCEREFKWLPTDDADPVPPEGYHCPYCNRCADQNSWFTKAQLKYVEQVGAREFGGQLMDGLEEVARESSFLRVERAPAPEPVKPDEPNDMHRVEFDCHPREPLKVAEDWNDNVHCLVCGRPRDESPSGSGR